MEKNQVLDQFEFSQTGEVIAKKDLVNDTSIYSKGFWGLIFCILGGLLGLVLVRISLQQATDALESYKRSPQDYLDSSYRLVLKGQRLARIGVGIFIGEIVLLVAYMSMN